MSYAALLASLTSIGTEGYHLLLTTFRGHTDRNIAFCEFVDTISQRSRNSDFLIFSSQ